MQRAKYSHLMCCVHVQTYKEMYLNRIYIDIKRIQARAQFLMEYVIWILWTTKKRWIDLLTFILHFMICIPSDITSKSKNKSIKIQHYILRN